MLACQRLQLFDQLRALFGSDKLGALHRIHQELELGHFKIAADHVIARGALLAHLNVDAEGAQCLNIAVKRLALHRNAKFRKCGCNFFQSQAVFFVSALQK